MAKEPENLLVVGGKFGDYDVVRLLGRGGMGEVYLVRDPASGESFAAKIMSPPSGEKRHEWRRRFAREAGFAMEHPHKNLVAVYDVGEDPDSGLCYMIMEFAGGGSVADLIASMG